MSGFFYSILIRGTARSGHFFCYLQREHLVAFTKDGFFRVDESSFLTRNARRTVFNILGIVDDPYSCSDLAEISGILTNVGEKID